MLFNLALYISAIIICLPLLFIICVPALEQYKKKIIKIKLFSIVILVLGIVIFATLLMSPSDVVSQEHSVYDISTITFDRVEYIDDKTENLVYYSTKNNVTVVPSNERYTNVIVESEFEITRHWLFDLKSSETKYTVYLEEDLYELYIINRLANME